MAFVSACSVLSAHNKEEVWRFPITTPLHHRFCADIIHWVAWSTFSTHGFASSLVIAFNVLSGLVIDDYLAMKKTSQLWGYNSLFLLFSRCGCTGSYNPWGNASFFAINICDFWFFHDWMAFNWGDCDYVTLPHAETRRFWPLNAGEHSSWWELEISPQKTDSFLLKVSVYLVPTAS
jgi:hypothetical protein